METRNGKTHGISKTALFVVSLLDDGVDEEEVSTLSSVVLSLLQSTCNDLSHGSDGYKTPTFLVKLVSR